MKVVYCLLIFLFVNKVSANISESTSENLLSTIRNTYLTSKNRVMDVEKKERKVLSSLYSINQKMKKMSKQRDVLINKMLSANGNAKFTAREIAELEEKIRNQRKVLSKKLIFIYKLGNSGVLPVLFSATSSHELDKILKYLKAYSENDYKIIVNYQKNLKKLNRKRKKLEVHVASLMRFKEGLKAQEIELEEKQKLKSQILSNLSQKKKSELSKINKVRKLTKTIVSTNKNLSISELLDDSFYAVKGNLKPPVAGELQKDYGIIQHPDFKYKLSHKGYYYTTDPYSEVKVVHKGRVAFQGEIQGYGKTIIIEHGDHYYTVYSKLGEIQVKQSQDVDANEVIAKTGEYLEGVRPGIYFEIRHFSDSIDPKNWMLASNEETARRKHEN